jgi:KUP system potassium uptake protein
VILLTVEHVDAPVVVEERRTSYGSLGHGFHRLVIQVGYMEQPPIHELVAKAAAAFGLPFVADEVTYYLGRETILASGEGRMGRIAESLYAYLQRNAVAADREFKIPSAQVVEIGMQIDL